MFGDVVESRHFVGLRLEFDFDGGQTVEKVRQVDGLAALALELSGKARLDGRVDRAPGIIGGGRVQGVRQGAGFGFGQGSHGCSSVRLQG
jgi:hypothetical protein